MTPEQLVITAINPALTLLAQFMGERVRTPVAIRFLTAIAIQESGLTARAQHGGGPAKSFWQFEPIGVDGVLSHPGSRVEASRLCEVLCYRLTGNEPANIRLIHNAIEHNDVLAAGFARLNLWKTPHPMPVTEDDGWRVYVDTWRPGKPDSARWPAAWAAGQAAA